MRRAAALLAAVLLLAGCGEPAQPTTLSGVLQAQWVDLPDGRVVVCVTRTRALSCDWATASREGEAP